MTRENWYWDLNMPLKKIKQILAREDDPRFPRLAGTLLARVQDSKQVFNLITPTSFCRRYQAIENEIKSDEWAKEKAAFWKATYLRLSKELQEKGEKIRKPEVIELDAFDRALVEKVKQCRKAAAMSQKELAQFMDYSQQFISGIETGREKITVEFLKKLSEITDQRIDLRIEKVMNVQEMFEKLKLIPLEKLEELDFTKFPLADQLKAFSGSSEYVKTLAAEVINPLLKGALITGSNVKEDAIVGCYYRAFAWMTTMAALREEIHFQAAASGARGLFEIWVDLELLSKNLIENGIERYRTFPKIERFRRALRIVETSDRNPDIKINDSFHRQIVNDLSKKQEVEALAMRVWGANKDGKPVYPDHWSGKNLRERVDSCAVAAKKVYYEDYARLSWYIHSGSAGYANLNKDALHMVFATSHIIAQRAFLSTLKTVSEEMKITKAVEWLKDYFKKLELAPGLLLLKDQL